MPDLTVIEGGGPEKDDRERQRARDRAKDDFSWAIREVAANILRIIRGAGKPYELVLQMQRAIDAAVKFREVTSTGRKKSSQTNCKYSARMKESPRGKPAPSHHRPVVGRWDIELDDRRTQILAEPSRQLRQN